MTPEQLAALHRSAFATSRGWSAKEFHDLLTSPLCFAVTRPQGFAVGRVVAGEAELLTIATHPDSQGQGIGRACLATFEAEAAQRGAASAFLEVGADNPAAIHLYRSAGWHETGRRKGYYTRSDGGVVDALLMGKALT